MKGDKDGETEGRKEGMERRIKLGRGRVEDRKGERKEGEKGRKGREGRKEKKFKDLKVKSQV
jgi:hypothetical protein